MECSLGEKIGRQRTPSVDPGMQPDAISGVKDRMTDPVLRLYYLYTDYLFTECVIDNSFFSLLFPNTFLQIIYTQAVLHKICRQVKSNHAAVAKNNVSNMIYYT
jgi:hypothetical protein